jgi:hypothetical protein
MAMDKISWAVTTLVTRASGQPGGHDETPSPADLENRRILKYMAWVWAIFFAFLICFRAVMLLIKYVRTISGLSNNQQGFFSQPNDLYASIKTHILDAPLCRKRHNREFRISAAINVGTLPTRFETLVLLGYFGMNVAYCVISIEWSGKSEVVLKELRNRTGQLAVMNMMPLFLLAGRNNPLIRILGISFNDFNLIHRWIGRVVVLESFAHTAAWTINKVNQSGWSAVSQALSHSQLILTGTIVCEHGASFERG